MKHLGEVAFFTDDVDGTSAFYRGLLGAAPIAECRDPDGRHVELARF